MNGLVRPPANTYSRALTLNPERPAVDIARARRQHQAYGAALRSLGVALHELPSDDRFPDCVFTQDPAFVVDDLLVVGEMGDDTRHGEAQALLEFLMADEGFPRTHRVARIRPPGTLEGGDVLLTEDAILLGQSRRTNPAGLEQLRAVTARPVIGVPVPSGFLHLLSFCSYLGGGRFLVRGPEQGEPHRNLTRALKQLSPRQAFDVRSLPTPAPVNALVVGDRALIAAGPGAEATGAVLRGFGLAPVGVDISEFEKRDGDVTCLSLVW